MKDRDDEFEAWALASCPRLLRRAFLLTGDEHEAQDLLQATLERLYGAWPKVRTETADAYARTVMVRTLVSWRRRVRLRTVPLTVESDHSVSVPDSAEQVERREIVLAALRMLPPGQRAALVLRFWEDLTEAQTADALGVSIGTVKSQVHRALATIRRSRAWDEFVVGTNAVPTPLAGDRSAAGQPEGGVR